ncbi:MAG: ATP synthase F1 subunit gamma [Bacteroidota bacterium]
MATLRDIRQRIGAVKNTAKITSAMKMVAAAKLRRAQDAIMAARPYAQKLQEILSNFAVAEGDFVHPLFQQRKAVTNIAVIVVSADRGLAGSFNANLLKAATIHIDKTLPAKYPGAKITVIPMGRRAVAYFKKRTNTIQQEFPDIFGKLQFGTAQEVAKIAVEGFVAEQFDKVEIIVNEFKSMIRQEVAIRPVLPVEQAATEETKNQHVTDYIFEPSREDMLEVLLPRYLDMQIWRGLLESNAAEQAARMMAMDNATTNARDLIKSLQLIYNKERQAAITKEMLEIVGGAEALNG